MKSHASGGANISSFFQPPTASRNSRQQQSEAETANIDEHASFGADVNGNQPVRRSVRACYLFIHLRVLRLRPYLPNSSKPNFNVVNCSLSVSLAFCN